MMGDLVVTGTFHVQNIICKICAGMRAHLPQPVVAMTFGRCYNLSLLNIIKEHILILLKTYTTTISTATGSKSYSFCIKNRCCTEFTRENA